MLQPRAHSCKIAALPEDPHMDWLKQLRQHLLTGVSFAIPFIACGGILIALSLASPPPR